MSGITTTRTMDTERVASRLLGLAQLPAQAGTPDGLPLSSAQLARVCAELEGCARQLGVDNRG
jgi:hypothetical protein